MTNQSSLKAWWKLDETNGVDASDSSIVGSTGSVENSTSGHWNPGKFGNALSLDGVNDYVHIYSYNGIGGGTAVPLPCGLKHPRPINQSFNMELLETAPS